MTPEPIHYFDNNATTQVAPKVVEAMLPFLRTHWANPSSAYGIGHKVAKSIEEAREKVAALIGADSREIIFTSCGTESNNTAIHSALVTQPEKKHVVTTGVEHSANIKFGEYLQNNRYQVSYVPVEPDGTLDLHLLEKAIRPDTAIVSAMWANNETGVMFPIEEIAAICRSHNVLCHSDAVQAAGKVGINVQSVGIDMLSLSAHKLHAPKGIGALYVKRRTKFQPYVIGGSQEQGRRGGTENVPYIVGFGKAAELALANLKIEDSQVRRLRDKLESGILTSIEGTSRNGASEPRLPNTTNISFEGVEAEGVLMLLDQIGVCASSGSACRAGSMDPSHVLMAMVHSLARARGSVRFSLGVYNTEAEVDYLLRHLPGIIGKLRGVSPKPGSREVLTSAKS